MLGVHLSTGLAREGSTGLKLVWKYVLPIIAKFMSGTSTPARSAEMLARILLKSKTVATADYVEFTGIVLEPYLPQKEKAYAQWLFDYSDQFV